MRTFLRSIVATVTDFPGLVRRWAGVGRPGEVLAGREMYQHYGFCSYPLPGATGIALLHGSDVVIIAEDDRRFRISLLPGEVALYDDAGCAVHLKTGGVIEITAPTSVVITAPAVNVTASESVTVTGTLAVTGDVTATGSIMDGAGNSNHHSHG